MLEMFRLKQRHCANGWITCYDGQVLRKYTLCRVQIEPDESRKAKGRKDRGGKKNLTSEIVIKPSSSQKDQGSRQKKRLSRAGSQRTRSKKRNHVLKVYYRKCRHNHAGVYRRTKIVCFYCKGKGRFARNCPNKEVNEEQRKVSRSQEKTSWFANLESVDQSESFCRLTVQEGVSI